MLRQDLINQWLQTLQQSKLAQAKNIWLSIERQTPNIAENWQALAGQAFAINQPGAAFAAVRRYCELRPKDGYAQLLCLFAQASSGEHLDYQSARVQIENAPLNGVPILELLDQSVRALSPIDWRVITAIWQSIAHYSPNQIEPLEKLVRASLSAERADITHVALKKLLQLDPVHLYANWLSALIPPSAVFESVAEQEKFRANWHAQMQVVDELLRASQTEEMLENTIRSSTNFVLPYVVDEVLIEQQNYAKQLHRMLEKLLGQAVSPIERTNGKTRERPRVGWVSAYCHQHSVSKVCKQFAFDLSSQVELHVFGVAKHAEDEVFNQLKNCSAKFHDQARDLKSWVELIRNSDLDALIFTDVGMQQVSTALANLRLVPLQIALWGHPVTSGSAAIDFFAAPDCFEPENAASHYSEQLIRLPSIGTQFEKLFSAPRRAQTKPATINIVCAQNLVKYSPDLDSMFARILLAVPKARLSFAPHTKQAMRDALATRMRKNFEQYGVDFDQRVNVHAFFAADQYQAWLSDADVALDTICFSGGITSFDCVAAGLPMVSIAGRVMRQRQTAGLLTEIGLQDQVALNQEQYIARAIRLATDDDERNRVRQHLLDHQGLIFDRKEPVRFFTRWLLDQIANSV